MIKIQIILLIVILSLSSCTIKTIEVDDETKKKYVERKNIMVPIK